MGWNRIFKYLGRPIVILAWLAGACAMHAQQYDPSLMKGLEWRQVGPFRGGRALAVTGIRANATTFYFGAASGGVWKTTNAGITWQPIIRRSPRLEAWPWPSPIPM